MPSSYVNNLRLEEMATGEKSGTWGTITNTNLELIGEALGYGTEDLASDADATITMQDATSDGVRSMYLKITSSASLTTTRTVTIAPNTVSKVWIIENATTGSQSITISQGSGSNVTIPSGAVKVIYTDGAGAGAAVVDALTNLGDLSISGDLTVDTNTLAVDSTNNRVGIGTASPSYTLDVSSSGNSMLRLVSSTTGSGDHTIIRNQIGGSSASNYIYFGDASDLDIGLIQYDHNGDYMRFYTNASEAMRILSSGNVGIGTSSPVYNCVVSNGGASGIEIGAGYSGTKNLVQHYNRSGSAYVDVDNVAAQHIFKIGTSEAMRIDSSVNVGIGTNSPVKRLTISGASNGNITTLTDGATITPDLDDSDMFTVTLGGNRTLANPTNIDVGQTGSIFIVQDGTGSRTLAFGSYWDFAGGVAPTLSTTASAVDRIDFIVRSSTSIHAVFTANYS